MTVFIVLRYMHTIKKTTVVFLAHLAICNLVQGVILLLRAIFFIWHVNTTEGCLALNMFNLGAIGSYVTGIFYVYLDLYLSIKKMAANGQGISRRVAVALCAISWIYWLIWGTVGYAMRDAGFVYNHFAGCSIMIGIYRKDYFLLVGLSYIVGFVVILTIHILTYKLIRNARLRFPETPSAPAGGGSTGVRGLHRLKTISSSFRRQGADGSKSRWIRKNDKVLKMIRIVVIMFMLCWYPLIVIAFIVTYCAQCTPYITQEVVYVTYVLVVLQYNCNGIIYLVKVREFKDACKKFGSRCCPRFRTVEPMANPSTANTYY